MINRIIAIVFLLIGFGISMVCFGAKNETPAVSTQGIEDLDQNVTTSKSTAKYKQTLRAKVKATKKYFKNKKSIKKQQKLQTKKINEIKYLEKRLEEKKIKQESFNPPEVKGENEE